MKCKKCGFDLAQGQDICPRCGTVQSAEEETVGGVSMDLPPVGAQTSDADTVASQETKKTEKKEEAKKTVKEAAEKAKEGVQKTAKKVKEASKEAAENIGEAAKDVTEKAKEGGSKTWLYVLIGVVAAAVLVVIGILVISYEPKGSDETLTTLMALSEDTIFVVEGDVLTEIGELPENVYAREIVKAIDATSFYLIDDAEYDEDAGEYIGDLLYVNSKGKKEDIDSDVKIGTMDIVGGILWYEKADKEDIIICCYDGKNAEEVVDEKDISSWYGTDKAGKVYYTTVDPDDYTAEIYLAENGDNDSIMDEAYIVAISKDYKKLVLMSQDDDSTVIIYDGKDDFDVIDEVYEVIVDYNTLDMLVIADEEDMVLYYIPYGKDEIEIDDEVEEILPMSYQMTASGYDGLGDMIYYDKEGDLYAADFKGKEQDKILKNYDELTLLKFDEATMELVYADDDEVVTLNISNQKETSVELPDADELGYYDVVIVGDWIVYRTEENKEIFAYDGKRDPIELTDDADEISEFENYMDKYVLWINIDDELVLSEMKEDSAEEIGDDIYAYSLRVTDDGEIYFLSDYEDSEGDLYYVSKPGKEAEKIEKGIESLFSLSYE